MNPWLRDHSSYYTRAWSRSNNFNSITYISMNPDWHTANMDSMCIHLLADAGHTVVLPLIAMNSFSFRSCSMILISSCVFSVMYVWEGRLWLTGVPSSPWYVERVPCQHVLSRPASCHVPHLCDQQGKKETGDSENVKQTEIWLADWPNWPV